MDTGNITSLNQANRQIAILQDRNVDLLNQNALLADRNHALEQKNQDLQRQLDWFKRQMFGQKSEKILPGPDDASYLPGFEGSPREEPQAKSTETVREHERKKREVNGWSEIPPDFPREEEIITDPEAEAKGMKCIGYEISERLARHASSYYVKVIKRAKYADPEDPLKGVQTACPSADSFGQENGKTKYDISFIAGIAVDKVENHLPLYRQAEIMNRQGLMINRSTLQHLFTKTAEFLTPLYERMCIIIDGCEIIHCDETTIRLLVPGNGKSKTAFLWLKMTAVGPPLAVFHFADSRSREAAEKFLQNYCGTIIRDMYSGYDDLPLEHAGCWAHVRRKFFDAEKAGYSAARPFLNLIRSLYEIERHAKDRSEEKNAENALYAERRIARKKSVLLTGNFFEQCKTAQTSEIPGSPLAKAVNYALNHRQPLEKFLRDPRINIDNNPAENIIRPIALGRKNWLFAGSEGGGQNFAVLASFAASCKLNHINFAQWLNDVMTRLPDTPISQLDSLLPNQWHGSVAANQTK